jgi:hypothetical protein
MYVRNGNALVKYANMDAEYTLLCQQQREFVDHY